MADGTRLPSPLTATRCKVCATRFWPCVEDEDQTRCYGCIEDENAQHEDPESFCPSEGYLRKWEGTW